MNRYECGKGDSQPGVAPNEQRSVENQQRERIIHLSTALLAGINGLSQQRAKEILLQKDIFATPPDELTKHAERTMASLNIKGLNTALELKDFYLDKSEVEIPEHVIVYKSGMDLSSALRPDEKALVYVTSENNSFNNINLAFSPIAYRKDSWYRRREPIKLKRPDVVLDAVSLSENYVSSISGADNIILFRYLQQNGASRSNGGPYMIDINAENTIAFMPGLEMRYRWPHTRDKTNYISSIRVKAKGNITQHAGSSVTAVAIHCHDYDRRGGEINYAAGSMKGKRVLIKCAGTFLGEEPDPEKFEIIDSKLAERQVREHAPMIANELGIEPQPEEVDIVESDPYEESLEFLSNQPIGLAVLSDVATLRESYYILATELDQDIRDQNNIRIVLIEEKLRRLEDKYGIIYEEAWFLAAFKKLQKVIDEILLPYEAGKAEETDSIYDVQQRLIIKLMEKRETMREAREKISIIDL